MARKKTRKKEEDNLTVQKCKPLLSLWRTELSLAEFKIVDVYLAKINSHDPKNRGVIFEKGELEEILGVKKINQHDLEDRLRHLMSNVVKLPSETSENGFVLVSLFDRAVAEQDKSGLWKVNMKCSEESLKYFFNIENLGYLRYRLQSIISLRSRYTYIMFLYLEDNRYRKDWSVPLDELKQILKCEDNEVYGEFKHFNNLVLKKIHQELHEKTECRFSYESIKNGRTVVAIRFHIESLPEAIPDDLETDADLWKTPLEPFGFSSEQLDEIFSILATIPTSELPQSPACYDSMELMRYHFMDQKAKEIIRRDAVKPIGNKFSYLLKLLKQIPVISY